MKLYKLIIAHLFVYGVPFLAAVIFVWFTTPLAINLIVKAILSLITLGIWVIIHTIELEMFKNDINDYLGD